MIDICSAIRSRVVLPKTRIALMAPLREPLDYDSLLKRTGVFAQFLSRQGLTRGDAIAMAMPDGPEALEAFLAVTRVAACAPLNPTFRTDEFLFFLSDIGARALIVPAGSDAAAVQAAGRLGVPVYEMPMGHSRYAGEESLCPPCAAQPANPQRYPDDTALLLHTSATTGRPKLVPLTHTQIIAMLEVIRTTFPLGNNGRVLVITPHFHLHALISVLAQLFSGGAVIATPGFRPERFFDWMRTFRPTQYTANPTLHRAILSLIPPEGAGDAFSSLRFVSSAGAPLPEELRDEIEQRLCVRVFEGYGLTEAGRVTLTPADPIGRKPGSVGRCYGIDVAITDGNGHRLGPGQIGEIVLRGPTVIRGYAHDPEADREAFRNGWFRTGDLGWLDEDDFLYLTGRIKEAINRGAEKILPYAIERVLSTHPAVQEAVVFGFPHPRLGEDIGAAVVSAPGASVTVTELRRFASAHLAEFEIPRHILFVDEIPKGRTGKVQRARMADLLPLPQSLPSSAFSQSDRLEARLSAIWSRLLKIDSVRPEEDFFLLGGDSLLALQMLCEVEEACGCHLGPDAIMASATLASLAEAVRNAQTETLTPVQSIRVNSCLRPLQRSGRLSPLFLICPESSIFVYRHLVSHLGRNRPVFALQEADFFTRASVPPTLEMLAFHYAAEMRTVQPRGPYCVGGYSLGGLLALETARHLLAADEEIAGIILIDSSCMRWQLRHRIRYHLQALRRCPQERLPAYLLERGRRALVRLVRKKEPACPTPLQAATKSYRLSPIAARALYLYCREFAPENRRCIQSRWSRILPRDMVFREVPGTHATVILEPHVEVVAKEILDFLGSSGAETPEPLPAEGK
ncbi:MAG: AMP-binding protein [Syntrophobacteraceae bacterium]